MRERFVRMGLVLRVMLLVRPVYSGSEIIFEEKGYVEIDGEINADVCFDGETLHEY